MYVHILHTVLVLVIEQLKPESHKLQIGVYMDASVCMLSRYSETRQG